MSRIFINHGVVQAQTASLRNSVNASLGEAEAELSSLLSSLDTKDGLGNARFIQAVENDKRKAQSAARGFTRILNFISGSAEQMRLEDARLAGMMQGNTAPPARGFGGRP